MYVCIYGEAKRKAAKRWKKFSLAKQLVATKHVIEWVFFKSQTVTCAVVS